MNPFPGETQDISGSPAGWHGSGARYLSSLQPPNHSQLFETESVESFGHAHDLCGEGLCSCSALTDLQSLELDIDRDVAADFTVVDIDDDGSIPTTIGSLEAQIEHLRALLERFQSEFHSQFAILVADVHRLPEYIDSVDEPVPYVAMLENRGRLMTHSSQYALDHLRRDLDRLELARNYTSSPEHGSHGNQASPSLSLMGLYDATADEAVEPRRAQASHEPSSSPLPIPRCPSLSSSLGSDLSGDSGPAANYGEELHPFTDTADDAERPRREVIIDWVRHHQECCREDSDLSTCSRCNGWRLGLEQAAYG